jgi:hypothetical protein
MPLLYRIILHRPTPIRQKIYKQNLPICVNTFLFQFYILHNYDFILSCLNFRTLYSRWWHLDALFLINIFKDKINCHSIMDTWYSCAHKANKRIFCFQHEQCTIILQHSPSARCVIAANYIEKELEKLIPSIWEYGIRFWNKACLCRCRAGARVLGALGETSALRLPFHYKHISTMCIRYQVLLVAYYKAANTHLFFPSVFSFCF